MPSRALLIPPLLISLANTQFTPSQSLPSKTSTSGPTYTGEIRTVTLYDLGYASSYASILAADSTATTYKVFCGPSEPTICADFEDGIPPDVTAVGGPSTAGMTQTFSDSRSHGFYQYNCQITASGSAFCAYYAEISGEGATTASTQAPITSDIRSDYVPLYVTAGLEKLNGKDATTTSGPTGTGELPKSTGAAGNMKVNALAGIAGMVLAAL